MSTFLPGWASRGLCFHVKPKSSPCPSNSRANRAPGDTALVPFPCLPPSPLKGGWFAAVVPSQWSVLRTADRGPSPVPSAAHLLPRCLQLTPSLSLSSFQNPHVSVTMYSFFLITLHSPYVSRELLIKCGNVLACTSGWASQVGLVVTQMSMRRDTGSVLGLRRSPEEGHGNPLQHSCLKSPTDRGAWGATVQGVAELGTPEHACLRLLT